MSGKHSTCPDYLISLVSLAGYPLFRISVKWCITILRDRDPPRGGTQWCSGEKLVVLWTRSWTFHSFVIFSALTSSWLGGGSLFCLYLSSFQATQTCRPLHGFNLIMHAYTRHMHRLYTSCITCIYACIHHILVRYIRNMH